ncbi:MAG: HAD family hydrolase [Rikenellaceae bacterium]
MKELTTVAIVYDFDGTLAAGNMQEYDFIPSVGMSVGEFWGGADHLAEEFDADSVLCYMEQMLSSARRVGRPITAASLREMGRSIPLFDGVEEWFDRVNNYGEERSLKIQHYVNSSGIREMIEGSAIADKFHKIYASSFMYDAQGEAYWPAVAINYTNKTQFIFKINKGIESVRDSTRINEFLPREGRPIPFSRIIFVGDGLTDIPSMRLVHSLGGHAIAVYDPSRSDKRDDMLQLIREGRVDYVCEANYNAASQMNNLIERILDKIAADTTLEKICKGCKDQK